MAFAAMEFFVIVLPSVLSAFARGDTLGIIVAALEVWISTTLFSNLVPRRLFDSLQRTIVPPFIEVSPDGLLGRRILGQVASLTSRFGDVENGVEDISHRVDSGTCTGIHKDQGFDQVPLFVAQVAGMVGVSLRVEIAICPPYRTDSHISD